MIRKIVRADNPILRRKSKPVKKIDKKILEIISDLKDTLLSQKDPEGVGLAAPQIGKNLKIFAMRDGKKIRTIINPRVIKKYKIQKTKDEKQDIMEGCLSIPHYYGPLKRAQKIKIEYLDENGKKAVKTFENLLARIVQHEIDHLNGILFTDKLLEQKKPLYELKEDKWEEINLV
jgi:peptide deformylase